MAWPEQQQPFPTLYSGFMIFSLSRFAASAPSSLSFFLAGCGAGQRLRPPSAAPLHLPGRRVRRPPPRAAAVSTSCRLDIVASLPFPSPPPQFPSPLQRLIPSSRFLSEMAEASTGSPKSVHDFTVKDARGNDVDLSTYKGKVLLIVNVASQCGLTNSNYTELSQLYEKYKEKDFEILAFPCNQFNGQEPGSNEEILEFACTRFKAEYPIFDKVDVNGENSAPIYKFLKKSKGGLLGSSIKWNFSKFLIDKEGTVVDRYAPTTAPLSIEKDIKKLLGL